MDHLPSEVYFKTQLKLNKFFGVWPYEEGTSFWRIMLANFLYYSMLSMKICSFLALVYHFYIEWGHLPDPIGNIITVSIHCNTIFGTVYVPYKIKRFQNLLKQIDHHFIIPHEGSDENVKYLFKKCMKSASFATKMFIGSAVMTAATYYIVPLTSVQDNVRPLPYQASFPFHVTSGSGYWFAYSFLATTIMTAAVNGILTCDFLISLMIKSTCQFRFLQYMLKNVKEDVKKRKNKKLQEKSRKSEEMKVRSPVSKTSFSEHIWGPISEQSCSGLLVRDIYETDIIEDKDISEEDEIENDLLVERLHECVILHQALLEIVDEVEYLASPFMLTQLFVYLIFLCLQVFVLSQVPIASSEFVSIVLFITCIMSLLLLFSWHGNEVKIEGLEVAEAAYDCDWIEAPQVFKKSLQMMIMRAQRPIKLTAWKFCYVDLKMFLTVMKATYSYYQVLRKMYS